MHAVLECHGVESLYPNPFCPFLITLVYIIKEPFVSLAFDVSPNSDEKYFEIFNKAVSATTSKG